MKKLISVLLAVILIGGCFSACGSKTEDSGEAKKLQVVTTIFPEYDWVKNVLGEKAQDAEITMLLDSGVDLHSYQPTAEDIRKISTCDLFVYVGGESDAWVEDALKEATNKDMVVLDLLEVLKDDIREEELVEGMQGEEEEEEEGEEEPEYDEHVWLSLKNTVKVVKAIEKALASVDSTNEKVYQENADAYVEKLNGLDQQYEETVNGADRKILLFGDRFPFRYLAEDYGLQYYAAFVGCSAETEASFETITFLAKKVDELSLPAVLTIEGDNHRIAETIIENTEKKNQEILTMDSKGRGRWKDLSWNHGR